MSVPEPTTALMAPAPTPASAIRIMSTTGTCATLSRARAPLLPHPHVDPYRAALEAEGLAQPPLEEAPIPGLQEARRKQHERRWPRRRLGREQDPRLLATTH